MLNYINFLSIILFILIIIIFYLVTRLNVFNKLINGFYEADISFCEESGVDAFCIYFDEDVSFSGSRACYILVKKNDNIIINEPTTAKLTLKWTELSNWSSDTTVKYFNVEFDDISDDIDEVFPRNQTIRFYPNFGKIVLFKDDIITACLYKNGINSELKSLKNEIENEIS